MSNLIYLLALVPAILVFLMVTKNNRKSQENLDDAIDFSKDDIDMEEIPLTKKEQRLQELNIQLIRAGFPIKAEEFNRLRLFSTLLVFGILFLITRSLFVTMLFTIVWFVLPQILIKFAQEKKKERIENQIPAALSLMRNSLEAGFSFLQSMEVISDEMDPPISEEFGRVLHELKVGKDLAIAMNNMLERIQSDEMRLVVIAVLIQREVGGNLGEIIDVILETIKDRIQIKGEIRTLTAQGRLSAVIVTLLPVFLGLIMYFMNPQYMIPFFESKVGQSAIGFAIFWDLIGIYIISRIIKIDF